MNTAIEYVSSIIVELNTELAVMKDVKVSVGDTIQVIYNAPIYDIDGKDTGKTQQITANGTVDIIYNSIPQYVLFDYLKVENIIDPEEIPKYMFFRIDISKPYQEERIDVRIADILDINMIEHIDDKYEIKMQGESAFELAVAKGFDGTLEEWLESLVGPAGLSAYEIDVENGYTGTVEEWLASLRVKGDKGDPGKSIYELAVEVLGFSGTEAEYLNSIPGKSLNYDWRGTSLGIKREDEEEFTYTDLKGDAPIRGVDYWTAQDKQEVVDEAKLAVESFFELPAENVIESESRVFISKQEKLDFIDKPTNDEVDEKVKALKDTILGKDPKEKLDTLTELAAAINNDPNYYETVRDLIQARVPKEDGKTLISVEDLNKLSNIEDNANYYVHPKSHEASMIVEDENHQFITALDRDNWDNILSKSILYTDKKFDDLDLAHMYVVDTLPTEDIDVRGLYFLRVENPTATPEQENVPNSYYEYIFVNDKWELIGSTQVDLSSYYTKSQIGDLAELQTTASTLVGAVNEVSDKLHEITDEFIKTNLSYDSSDIVETEDID